MIFYEENFSSEIKIIDSSFSKLVYSFHSGYQEIEVGPSMEREKSSDQKRVKGKSRVFTLLCKHAKLIPCDLWDDLSWWCIYEGI